MAGGGTEIVEQGPRRPHRPRRVGPALLAALVAGPLIGVLATREASREATREEGRPAPVATPAPVKRALAAVTPNAVHPAPSEHGDTRTLLVTFPDGSRAEVGYPAGLSLDSLGARPYAAGTLAGGGGFRTLVAPLYGEAETAAGRPMIRSLTGNVTLWPGPLGVDSAGPVMLFAFGDWRLALQDGREGLTFEQRLAWARHLHGRSTPDGFLTLSAGGPVRLARPGEVRDGVLVGPQLWLGGLSRRMVVLAPVPGCGRAAGARVVLDSRHPVTGTACRDGFYLAAAGDRDFVRGVLRDVRVRRR